MKTMNAKTYDRELACSSPYDARPVSEVRNPVVRVGMSVIELFAWLVLMALLSIGMLVLLWNVSR